MELKNVPTHVGVCSTPATLNRCNFVSDYIRHTFALAYKHLSLLEGRTIDELCLEKNIPTYTKKIFTAKDYKIMKSDPIEQWNTRLLYKLLRFCCGLAPRDDPRWSKDQDTLEFLITFCWTEALNLKEASAIVDDSLNSRLDKILEALVGILCKVEEKKGVNLSTLKTEMTQHIGEKINTFDVEPSSLYMFNILIQHLVHQVLVMVYKELNRLKGQSLSQYLRRRRINLIPRTFCSNEDKFLEQDPPPEKMPISVLYRVVQRVCFHFSLRRFEDRGPSTLEYILQCLRQEHYAMSAQDGQTCNERCYKIYRLLTGALTKLAELTHKTRQQIVRSLPEEPVLIESLSKLPKLSPCSPLPQVVPSQHHSQPSQQSSSCDPIQQTASSQSLQWALNTNKNNLTIEEMNVCLLFKVLCPGGVVARTLTTVFVALQGNVKNIPSDKWKKIFTKDERDKAEGDLSQCDITLLYKLLKYACHSYLAPVNDNVWINQGDNLEYYITSVKKIRNGFSHETISLSSLELKDVFKSIKEILEKMLIDTETKMNIDLRSQIVAVRDELKQIETSLPTNNYCWSVEELRKLLTNQMEVNAKQELLLQYKKNLSNMSPITWTHDSRHENLTTEKVFVERELEDVSDVKAQSYTPKDILFSQNNELSSYRVIIIQGRAGDGKTSICKYLYYLWSDNVVESSQQEIDLLIYIPARYVTTESLSAYLKKSLPDTFKDIEKDDIIPLMQQPQVLFIVDGYNEAGDAAKALIDDILFSLPDCRMIITSMPQWIPKLKSKVSQVTSNYKVLSVVGLTEEKRGQYIKNIFTAMFGPDQDLMTECNEFLASLNELREQMHALIQLPLTLSLLVLLWIEDSGKAKKTRTITELYHKLTRFILKRLETQLNVDENSCYEWMLSLGKVAWNNLQKKQHHLNQINLTALMRKGRELHVDGNRAISSLLHCDTQATLTDSIQVWTFTHSTQQEYFAAEYIVYKIIEDNASIRGLLGLQEEEEEDKFKKKLQRLIPVIEFICGLLALKGEVTEEHVKEITELVLVKESWSFMAVMRISRELLGANPDVQRVLKKSFANIEMDTFDRYDPQSVHWILSSTSLVVPKKVYLTNSMSSVTQMRPLLELLLNKSCSIDVILTIDKLTNIESVAKFIQQLRNSKIKFIFKPWNSHYMTEVIKKWPWPSSLHLMLQADVFPLLWWELLLCLLSSTQPVDIIAHGTTNEANVQLVQEGAGWLGAKTTVDNTLGPTDLIIHCLPSGNSCSPR